MESDPYQYELLRKEMERYKSLYEQEREQFDEFQRYSKEVENELEIELKSSNKRVKELELGKSRLVNELDNLRSRYEHETKEFIASEQHLRNRLQSTEETIRDLRQKLRKIEQANDDLERRERIQAQELIDFETKYDHCLERCAFLEAGMIAPNSFDASGDLHSKHLGLPPNHQNASLFLLSSNSLITPDVVMSDRTFASADQNLSSGGTSGVSGVGSDVDEILHHSPLSNGDSKNLSFFSTTATATTTPFTARNEYITSTPASSPSSVIVSRLIRKIEEAQNRVNPNKFIIRPSPLSNGK